MKCNSSNDANVTIRPLRYGDLEVIEHLAEETSIAEGCPTLARGQYSFQHIRHWYGLLRCLSLFPNFLHRLFQVYVAEQDGEICGAIQVSPFNYSGSTWRVDQIGVSPAMGGQQVGSQLLRYCFETIRQARTWILEVGVNDKQTLALYRQNGFHPLAEITHWAIAPHVLQELAAQHPDLPNLLPVSNADAQLLLQLDTAAMPPLVRQTFDRQIQDFQTGPLTTAVQYWQRWTGRVKVTDGYIFETQRKAAIVYFQLYLCQDGSQPHVGQLTIHPGYTRLFPELLAHMARLAEPFPCQSLRLASADYQPQQEEYLEKMGASQVEHTLMMSRSVWHKLREPKPAALEGLQLSGVLPRLQPTREPMPGRIPLPSPFQRFSQKSEESFSRPNSLSSPPAPQADVPDRSVPEQPPSTTDPSPQVESEAKRSDKTPGMDAYPTAIGE